MFAFLSKHAHPDPVFPNSSGGAELFSPRRPLDLINVASRTTVLSRVPSREDIIAQLHYPLLPRYPVTLFIRNNRPLLQFPCERRALAAYPSSEAIKAQRPRDLIKTDTV